MGEFRVRALVTGSEGSLGGPLCDALEAAGWIVSRFDLAHGQDITDLEQVMRSSLQLDVVFHLAAAKHAPEGELDPWATTRINVQGTHNILKLGARTILASTCKAADPETVYGATKLIAERMVLTAGGSVARFYNVREAAGNVFETWAAMSGPLPVMPCARYFISRDRAVALLLALIDEPSGRYTINPGELRWMHEEARELYPDCVIESVPPRRGDRLIEPRYAACEIAHPVRDTDLERIQCRHDPKHEIDRSALLV